MDLLRKAKLYGGIGSILLLLNYVISIILSAIIGITGLAETIMTSLLPFLVSITGYILILIAVKFISEVTNDEAIYNNVFNAVILFIIGLIVATIISYVFLFKYFEEFLQDASIMYEKSPEEVLSLLFLLLFWSFVIIVIIAIFFIVGSIFLRRGFYRIAELVKVDHFRTVALLYFIGSILMVIFIGVIVIFIANIFMAIAFFSIREQPPHIPPTPV
jgi:uncharacterized membrane protein